MSKLECYTNRAGSLQMRKMAINQGPAASCPENPSLLPRTKLASRTAPVRALNRIRVDRSMRSPCNPLEPPDGA